MTILTLTMFDNVWQFFDIFDIFDNFDNFWQFWQFLTILTILTIFDNFWGVFRVFESFCDLRHDTWDTDYISDNWEQQYGQLHCDLWIESDGDSIRNSCDVSFRRCNRNFFSFLSSGHGGMFWPFCEKLWTVEHPERVVSFKKEAERAWKSGVTSLSWKSGWKAWTIREFWHQQI